MLIALYDIHWVLIYQFMHLICMLYDLHIKNLVFMLKGNIAGIPGFEPRLPGPEPSVLPLNYIPRNLLILRILAHVKYY